MKRRIAVVTTSRADYRHLYWPLRALRELAEIDLRILALGSHLSPEFGHTAKEIERDGFPIGTRIECLLSSDTDIGRAKTIGIAALGLADALGDLRPDLLLLIANRYEMLAPALVALALRIPVAHIEAEEVSEGAIEDAVRNALTKLSHIHFTATERGRERVVAMGEEAWRVHCVGAPSLDRLRREKLLSCKELDLRLRLDLKQPTVVVAYHQMTAGRDMPREVDALFGALASLREHVVFCYPNADADSRELIERTRTFLKTRRNGSLFVNLDAVTYLSLLGCVELMIGNSSSGIMEAPALKLPAVNIGPRQQGRERARNVLDAPADPKAILEKVRIAKSAEFRRSLAGMTNPYGDGLASERIVKVLTGVPLGEKLLMKRAIPADSSGTKTEKAMKAERK